MTVLEVNERIEELENMREDLVKLQNYFMGIIKINDISGEKMPEKDTVIHLLEEGCNLTQPIRPLITETAKTIGDEVERLKKLIDKTEVIGVKLIR